MLINELDAKRLEVLKEILPSARRFGLLIEKGTRAPADLQQTSDTAQALGVALQNVEVSILQAFRLPSPLSAPEAPKPSISYPRRCCSISEKNSVRCYWQPSFRRFASGGR
jgi:hypothetical protein